MWRRAASHRTHRKQPPGPCRDGIGLGRHDGLDLLQDIRNNYYDLPVILFTAYPEFKHDLRSIAADYYVVKSADLDELKVKIRMSLDTVVGMPFTGKSRERGMCKTVSWA